MSSTSYVSQTASDLQYDAITIMLDWDKGDVDMSLISPSGAEYTVDEHPNNVWYLKEGNPSVS